MKCLCGYEDAPGENTFIEIQHIERQLGYSEELNDYEYQHIYLIACPDCGTVKVSPYSS